MCVTHRYFMVHKPFNMVSQFISPDKVVLLGDLDYDFPDGTHAIGRLDNHSEGLLLLTTDKRITRLLFSSKIPHQRTYLVQVNKVVSAAHLQQLNVGIAIRVKGGGYYTTSPCIATIVPTPTRFKREHSAIDSLNLTSTWLSITLTEGKFHQIRKMVAAIHHRCLRLIRISIEDMNLGNLPPGQVLEIKEEKFFRELNLEYKPKLQIS